MALPIVDWAVALDGLADLLAVPLAGAPVNSVIEEIRRAWVAVNGMPFHSTSVSSLAKPENRPLPPTNFVFDEELSDGRYANGITAAIRSLDPSKGRDPDFGRRKPVYHAGYQGVVRPRGSSLYDYVTTVTNESPILSVSIDGVPSNAHYAKLISPTGELVARSNVWSGRPVKAVSDWAQSAVPRHTTHGGAVIPLVRPLVGYAVSHYEFVGFRDFALSDGVISWTDEYVEGWYGNWVISHCKLRLDPILGPGNYHYISQPAAYAVRVDFQRSWVHRLWEGHLLVGTEYANGEESFVGILNGDNFVTARIESQPDVLPYVGRIANALRQELPTLRPSVHVVAHQALSELRQRGVNLIEPAYELPGLLSMYPKGQIEALFAIASTATNPAKGGRYVRSVVKVLRQAAKAAAGGYLLYSFGWAPMTGTVNDAYDKLSKAADMFQLIDDQSRVRKTMNFKVLRAYTDNVRVSVGFTIGGELPPHVGPIETANSLGVLPTFSRLYEIQPWLWLLEYVVRFGFALGLAETVVWLLLLRARGFEYGYVQTHTPSAVSLAEEGLETDPTDPFTIRLYNRELSTACPFLLGQLSEEFFEGQVRLDIVTALILNFLN